MMIILSVLFFFFFNDTATTEIYTLSLHDALPISADVDAVGALCDQALVAGFARLRVQRLAVLGDMGDEADGDRKSTRLNSSHANISYAVFCLKKKKKQLSLLIFHHLLLLSINLLT